MGLRCPSLPYMDQARMGEKEKKKELERKRVREGGGRTNLHCFCILTFSILLFWGDLEKGRHCTFESFTTRLLSLCPIQLSLSFTSSIGILHFLPSIL